MVAHVSVFKYFGEKHRFVTYLESSAKKNIMKKTCYGNFYTKVNPVTTRPILTFEIT